MPPVHDPHTEQEARTYLNLSDAHQKASRRSGYNSAATRVNISQLFQVRFGGGPYDWQLDVMEAILLGLDTVVIAGTGAGKTMPFVMPLLLDEKKKAIVISPLKILQADQVCDFLSDTLIFSYPVFRLRDFRNLRFLQLPLTVILGMPNCSR